MSFTNSTSNESDSLDALVPAVYLSAKTQLPFSNLSVGATGEFLIIDDNEIQIFDAFIGYKIIDNLAFDITLKAGYSHKSVNLDDIEGFTLDNTFSGPYFAIEGHL